MVLHANGVMFLRPFVTYFFFSSTTRAPSERAQTLNFAHTSGLHYGFPLICQFLVGVYL
jgi:hypothetical protein